MKLVRDKIPEIILSSGRECSTRKVYGNDEHLVWLKKKMEEEQQLLANLKKGDDIYTKSGVLGKIIGITDKVITLDIDEGSKLKVLRSQVGGLSAKIFETPAKKD